MKHLAKTQLLRGLIISILILPGCLIAQVSITGKVIDRKTGKSIPYASIGIVSQGVGTVTSSDGVFDISIPQHLMNAVLLCSHVGYQDSALTPSCCLSGDTLLIALQPSKMELNEVTVLGQQSSTLGYKPDLKSQIGYFKTAGLGGEGGTEIRVNEPVQLQSFNMDILKMTFDTLKFRLNFYSIKRHRPNQKLNQSDIIFELNRDDLGLFTLSLEPFNLNISEDFICSIELIEILGAPNKDAELTFSASTSPKSNTVRRMISQGKWEKFKGYHLCFWFDTKK